jgi:hypothetical protein
VAVERRRDRPLLRGEASQALVGTTRSADVSILLNHADASNVRCSARLSARGRSELNATGFGFRHDCPKSPLNRRACGRRNAANLAGFVRGDVLHFFSVIILSERHMVVLGSAIVAVSLLSAQATQPPALQAPEMVQLVDQNRSTWTYTYVKATDGNINKLKQFIEANWFAMDQKAIRKGLFRNYKLIENVAPDTVQDWDVIVAVEYFGDGGYTNKIAKAFDEIRASHQYTAVDGQTFKDLGTIVRTEQIKYLTPVTQSISCNDGRFADIAALEGRWEEFGPKANFEVPFGLLEISLNFAECSFRKKFTHYNRPFSYISNGYYNQDRKKWSEVMVFSSGGYSIFEATRLADGSLDEVLSGTPAQARRRNRWTVVDANQIDIISEASEDDGKTWINPGKVVLRRKS